MQLCRIVSLHVTASYGVLALVVSMTMDSLSVARASRVINNQTTPRRYQDVIKTPLASHARSGGTVHMAAIDA